MSMSTLVSPAAPAFSPTTQYATPLSSARNSLVSGRGSTLYSPARASSIMISTDFAAVPVRPRPLPPLPIAPAVPASATSLAAQPSLYANRTRSTYLGTSRVPSLRIAAPTNVDRVRAVRRSVLPQTPVSEDPVVHSVEGSAGGGCLGAMVPVLKRKNTIPMTPVTESSDSELDDSDTAPLLRSKPQKLDKMGGAPTPPHHVGIQPTVQPSLRRPVRRSTYCAGFPRPSAPSAAGDELTSFDAEGLDETVVEALRVNAALQERFRYEPVDTTARHPVPPPGPLRRVRSLADLTRRRSSKKSEKAGEVDLDTYVRHALQFKVAGTER